MVVVVRRCPQCLNIFFPETAWPIKAKFYVEPPWVGGTKLYSRHLCHMTRMAATPIYGKKPSKIFSGLGGLICRKLGMSHRGLLSIIAIPPVNEVYRGYIVFAFSVRMFVCLSVCKKIPSKISRKLLDLGF